jgi:molecular chaperone GrpE
MPDQTIDNAIADAALESVTAEARTQQTQSKPTSGSAAEKRIAELEQQLRDANDRALRSNAELENYRKRSQRELVEERRYAVVPLVRDLLPVVDNLERAIEAAQARSGSEGNAPAVADVASLLEGLRMVATQLEGVLKQHECVRIETVGTPFDPNYHQALAQEPSEEHPAGTVTRAVQAGYKLHDRVIRPAQVFVSTGPSK